MKTLILGMGKSGLAVAHFLAKNEEAVVINDIKPEKFLQGEIDSLPSEIEVKVGHHNHTLLDGITQVVVSPGIPPELPLLKEAERKGIKVIGEVEFAAQRCPGKIIAVTGSCGKTTTVCLLGEILKKAKRNFQVCGNIGKPFTQMLPKISAQTLVILEVSSFQLQRVKNFRPYLSIFLNVGLNHLDYHKTYSAYLEAKSKIFVNQEENDLAIVNADNPTVIQLAHLGKARKYFFSQEKEVSPGAFIRKEKVIFKDKGGETEILTLSNLFLPPLGSVENILVSVIASKILGVASKFIREGISEFKGLPHRMEFFEEKRGVRFINDSKATTPLATKNSLQMIPERIILILGGRDKGGDFTILRDALREKVKEVVVIGEAKEKIKKSLKGVCPSKEAAGLKEAVEYCYTQAQPGDVILLSPACSSFDAFKNFETRGEEFKKVVRKL
jgi:UDP-N-acetylmuramoylalanine--D-glutamate ligase